MKTVAVLWSLCHFHDRESERIYFSRHQIPEYVNTRGRIRMICYYSYTEGETGYNMWCALSKVHSLFFPDLEGS